MGATEDDEEALIREVEIPNTLNIAATLNEMKVMNYYSLSTELLNLQSMISELPGISARVQ